MLRRPNPLTPPSPLRGEGVRAPGWMNVFRESAMNIEARRAALGAKYLDHVYPGWAEKINIYQIDMYDGLRCIKGQLYGSYSRTLSNLGGAALEAQIKEDIRLGFLAAPRWVLFGLRVFTRRHFEKQLLELRVAWYREAQLRQMAQRLWDKPLAMVA